MNEIGAAAEVFGEKCFPVPLCPPLIPRGLALTGPYGVITKKSVILSSYFVSGYRIEIWSLSKALFNLYAGSSYVFG